MEINNSFVNILNLHRVKEGSREGNERKGNAGRKKKIEGKSL